MKNVAKFFIEGSILFGVFIISYVIVYMIAGPHFDPDGFLRAEFRDTTVEIGMLELSGILAIHLGLGVYLLRALISRFHPPVNGIIYVVLCLSAFFIAQFRAEQFKSIYSLYQLQTITDQTDSISDLQNDEQALRAFLNEIEQIPGKSEFVHSMYLYSFIVAALIMTILSLIAYRRKKRIHPSQN